MNEFRFVIQGDGKKVYLVQITATLHSVESLDYIMNILTMIQSVMTEGDALSAALYKSELPQEPPDGDAADA